MKLAAKNQTSDKRQSLGMVEVNHEGKWKLICGKHWTKNNADVTCKDLGFSQGAIETLLLPFDVKENRTSINYNYKCTGKEEYLIECPSTIKIGSRCPYVANIRCKNEGISLINFLFLKQTIYIFSK